MSRETSCRECGGWGKVPDPDPHALGSHHTCYHCGGTGEEPEPDDDPPYESQIRDAIGGIPDRGP